MDDGFSFVDAKDRRWNVKLDMAAARRIDNSDFSALGYTKEQFSFLAPSNDNKLFVDLYSRGSLLCAVIYAAIQPQIQDKLKLDPQSDEALEEFLSGMDGQTVDNARAAFWRSLVDFFRDQKTALLAAQRHWNKLMLEADQAVLDMENQVQATIKTEVGKMKEKAQRQLEKDLASTN